MTTKKSDRPAADAPKYGPAKTAWIAAQPKGRPMPLAQLLHLAATYGIEFAPMSKNKIPICETREGGKRVPLAGSTNAAQIKAWAKKFPWMGVPKPSKHGLVVVDIDIKNAPETETGLVELDEQLGTLIKAAKQHARSQSGGYHFWFKAPDGLRNKPRLHEDMPTSDELKKVAWCETRSNSPAIAYELTALPGDDGFALMPPWLALTISPPSKKKKAAPVGPPAGGTMWDGPEAALAEIEQAEEGTRNSTLYRVAVQFLRDAGLTEQAQQLLQAAGVKAGLPEEEVAGVVASALARAGEATYYEQQQAKLVGLREAIRGMWEKYPKGHMLEGEWIVPRPTDVFIRYYASTGYIENRNASSLDKRGEWREIVDGRWRQVPSSEIEQRIRSVIKALGSDQLPAKEMNEQVNATKRELMAEALAGCTDDTDTTPHVLDCTGLPICLEKGKIGPVEPSWDVLLKRRLGVAYDPDADDDLYARTAAECRAGGWPEQNRPELIACDERLDGFELLQRKFEKWIVFEVGGGDNGKSLLGETKIHYMGDYGHVMNPAPLMEGYKQEVLTGLNSMIGKRVSIIEEVPAGQYLETPTLKMISGGSEIEVRERYEDNKNVRFGSLIRFLSNTRPEFRDTSKGWRNRMLLWTYKNEFTDARGNVNKMLGVDLRRPSAGSGWLNRALKGLAEFYRLGGVMPPHCLRQETAQYAQERGSPIKTFCEYFLERDEAATNIAVRDLYGAVARWLAEQGDISDVRDTKEVGKILGSTKRFGDVLSDITSSVGIGGGRARVLRGYKVNDEGRKYLHSKATPAGDVRDQYAAADYADDGGPWN